MKVVERATTPDGTIIQVEDWRENYKSIKTLSIATYPILRRFPTTRILNFYRLNETIRVDLDRNLESDAHVWKIFEQLKTGQLKVEDCRRYFREQWYVEIFAR